MASSLTKDQQLSAANAQYKNWLNQQIAANGGYYPTIDQINSYKAGILNTGLYPNLDMGVSPPPPGSDVNIAPSQFFIVGQGGDLQEDRGSGFTGQAIFSAGISDSTTLQQFTAAQDAYQLGLEQVYQTQGKELASQAQAAQSALAAAQARVKALEAQLAADSVVDPTLTSSAEAQAASSATNQRLGQEISPQRETQLDAINQQYNDYRSSGTVIQNSTATGNATRQAQLDAINSTYTATSSGSGTDVTTQTQTTTNTALQNINRDRYTDATAVSNTPNTTNNSTGEDNPQNGSSSSRTDSAVYTDQQLNGMRNRGLPDANQTNTQETTNGSNSVSILKQGAAYGSNAGTNTAGSKTGGSASRVNKLHNYVNYTYRISMYAVPHTTINAIYESGTEPTNQTILANSVFICSDSGQGGNQRSSYFPNDLTIDNLELDTIVNANSSRTRATDVIKFKFEIIEPYTVNFLARLKKLNAAVNPDGNWSTMFFVMKIEFMGYTDSGQPIVPSNSGDTIPNTTKFIPFTMISMKFNVTSNGGKYTINAIPPNALGLTALDNQIPFHVEVSGTTINEIFNAGLESSTEVTKGSGRTNQEKQVTSVEQNTVNGSNTTVKKGLAKALNQNEEQKVKQKSQKSANKYKFVFLDDIGNTSVLDPQGYFKIQGIPGTTGKDQKDVDQGKVGSLVVDLTQNVFRANPGTRITDFIGSLLTVSQYMTSQYKNDAGSKNPVKTWKITPVVKFGDIDPGTNYYSREITYYIKSYESYGQDSKDFGQAPVKPEQIVKTYKYIYSGDNRDVLDANIDFNMAFFELKNGVPQNYIDGDGLSPGKPQPNSRTLNSTTPNKFFIPRYHNTNGLANRQNIGPNTVDLASISVQELMEKLFDNRGDMIKLDFTIVGDPDWISQDYALMNPSIIGKNPYLNNGSINFSNSVYFNFYFATPNNDYNDNTGLFNMNGDYSEFSGIYYTNMVKSTFSGGKFTQKLNNYRVRNQEEIQTSAIRSDSASPNASKVSNNLIKPPLEQATNNLKVQNPNEGYNSSVSQTPNRVSDTYVEDAAEPTVGVQ